LLAEGKISAADPELFRIADDPEEVMAIIKEAHANSSDRPGRDDPVA
jgi:predicted Rossmann-fold nucleotide-binding protein